MYSLNKNNTVQKNAQMSLRIIWFTTKQNTRINLHGLGFDKYFNKIMSPKINPNH